MRQDGRGDEACADPVCSSQQELMQRVMARMLPPDDEAEQGGRRQQGKADGKRTRAAKHGAAEGAEGHGHGPGPAGTQNTAETAAAEGAGAGAAAEGCPLTRETLGTATWGLLHTTAAYFPEKPEAAERNAAESFVRSLATLYACSYCAEDFQEHVKESPPRVASRADFLTWTCEAHNRVNERLGKPAYPCTMERLMERWRTGRPDCWQRPAASAPAASNLHEHARDRERERERERERAEESLGRPPA